MQPEAIPRRVLVGIRGRLALGIPGRVLVGIVAVLGLLAGACGADGTDTAGTDPVSDTAQASTPDSDAPPADTQSATGEPFEGRGWIGGEPDWHGDDAETADFASEAMAEERFESAGDSVADSDLDFDYAEDSSAPALSTAPPLVPAGEPGQPQRALTGGSIDDNERFDEYLAYRSNFQNLGIPVRQLDPSGRVVVTVTGAGGLPAAGAEVFVVGGGAEVSLHTTADGTVRFHPEAYGAPDEVFTATAGGVSAEFGRGESVALETGLPTYGRGGAVGLDILFLFDATGSMSDEIDRLKATIADVVRRVQHLSADVDARLAMTLYRDRGDAFLTATFDFTSDFDVFADALSGVVADGGGDYPEALDEGLAASLSAPSWRAAGEAIQLIFLVADAPPQVGRAVPAPYTDSMLEAAERGIKIFPVSSSGTDDQAEYVFRQLAQFTGGRYVFLTYGAEGRATGGSTDITELDYEEMSLDDLIVRTITEELADLAGPR